MSARSRRLLLAALGLVLLAAPAPAQDDSLPLEVHVTAIAGGSVYIDLGREAGIETGDKLRLFPVAAPAVAAEVRAVSKSSARAVLLGPLDGLVVGDRGEVLVPADRPKSETPKPETQTPGEDAPPPAPPEVPVPGAGQDPEHPAPGHPDPGHPASGPPVPEHPPWEHPPETWGDETPLLAPISAYDAEDRPTRMSGRVYEIFDWAHDREEGDRKYLSSRTGVDLRWDNPFDRAGELDVDLEVFHRTADVENGNEKDNETRLRIDRLSYAWGGDRDARTRWQVGRFLQHEFPEFGVVDGVEVGYRFDSGHRLGASVGLMPEWDDEFKTGDDTQAALFYRWVSGEEETLALGAGYQKTWHEGEADRDLLVFTGDYHPSPLTWLYAGVWVDLYSGSNDLESGAELTQLQLNATQRFEGGHGIGVFLTQFRWPDLLKDDFFDLTPEQIDDDKVTRYGANGWYALSKHWRLDGRISPWKDQDDSGGTSELGVRARDVLWDRGSVRLGVYDIEGKYTCGTGFRISADRQFDAGLIGLGLDIATFEQSDFFGEDEDLAHNTLRASYDTGLGERCDLSLYAEDRFGDEQDALSLGVLLQWRP